MAEPAAGHRHLSESDLRPLSVETPAGVLAGWSLDPSGAAGAPVLFVHPINLQGACWIGVARALDPPRRAAMPDLHGHGRSHASPPFGLREWAADCIATLDALGLDSVHVVGGSLGGPLAVYLAAHHPERVRSIVAIGAAIEITGDNPESVLGVLREKGVRGMFREVIPQISVAPGTSQAVIDEILELANPNDAETVAAIWGATISSSVREETGRVRCPALVVVGEHDATCTPAQGEELAAALGTACGADLSSAGSARAASGSLDRAHGRQRPTPRAVPLEVLPGLGHLPMVEDPARTAAVVSEFLRSVEDR